VIEYTPPASGKIAEAGIFCVQITFFGCLSPLSIDFIDFLNAKKLSYK